MWPFHTGFSKSPMVRWPQGNSVFRRPGCDLINRAPSKTIPTFYSPEGGPEEHSSFAEECYLPVTVMVPSAGVKKKNLQLLQQTPSQQPAQNTHIYLSFIHNF